MIPSISFLTFSAIGYGYGLDLGNGTVFDTNRSFISVTENQISKLKSSIKLIHKIDCKIVKV